jgi:hypothetical protein
MFTTAPLFGKFHSPLKAADRVLRRRPLHHLESLCTQRIGPRLLQPNATGANSRQRIYTRRLTFLAFLDQTLDPDSSCRSAVDQILAYYQALPHPPPIDPDTSAYCQARARWTCEALIDIRWALARGPALHGDTLPSGIPGQRALKVIDGTGFNLPDTAANRALCSPSEDQKPGCGFPLVRMVGIFRLKTGMLLEETAAPYTTSENELFHDLWPTFCPGDILVADRNFCSYGSLAVLHLRYQSLSFYDSASAPHEGCSQTIPRQKQKDALFLIFILMPFA